MTRKKYTLPDLIKRWEREQITTEQAIGQILLWLVALSKRIEKLERARRKGQQPNRPHAKTCDKQAGT